MLTNFCGEYKYDVALRCVLGCLFLENGRENLKLNVVLVLFPNLMKATNGQTKNLHIRACF